MQCVGELQLDVCQPRFLTARTRQVEHGGAVVQRHYACEAPRQLRQETAIPRTDFQRRGAGIEVQRVEQGHHAVAVLRQAGDKVLTGLKAVGHAREEILAGGAALGMHGGDTGLDLARQLQPIGFLEQRRVQLAAGAVDQREAAQVEHRVAFAAGCQQPSLGKYLEVVAHAGLTDGEDLRQLQYTERIAGQRPQYVQAQRIATGLAQGGERITGVETDLGYAQAHKRRSLVGHFSYSKGNIKKF